MSIGFVVQTKGLEPNAGVLKVLNGLDEQVRKRIMRKAVWTAAGPLLKEAKGRVTRESDRTGMLANSLIRKRKTYGDGSITWVGIGPDKSDVLLDTEFGKVVPGKYAHLVEFGTKRMKARSFLRKTLDANFNKVITTVAAQTKKGIASYLKRAVKRGA